MNEPISRSEIIQSLPSEFTGQSRQLLAPQQNVGHEFIPSFAVECASFADGRSSQTVRHSIDKEKLHELNFGSDAYE
ncbi:hypothetical protein L596_006574 [Steinernema carpocapsae]|uniref:Uncharacterized protein n=1 Tax=Steinernema carpocapsae TaxID=34508 RepID=A0A4U8V9R8_STECR|nr:hypothetical protein L596_006574 [Steinernema carpocapsae]